MRTALTLLTALLAALALSGCSRPKTDADVVVIGAGIAGLSAAIEASDGGAQVVVIDANSMGGGHAIKAGGFALVGTPLQESKGYKDSPDLAFKDLMAWGEDADPVWVRRYVEDSRKEVHDWIEGFDTRFTFVLETPEHSVPRFHFAGGSARGVVVPMMWTASAQPNIKFQWNTEVVRLIREKDRIVGVETWNLRTGAKSTLRAGAVVIATGGFEADLDRVRASWQSGETAPAKIYVGAGEFARGSGIDLGQSVGAGLYRMDHQAIFTGGLPDPKSPDGERALHTTNPAAIWVNAAGRRFTNETGASKDADAAVLAQTPAMHWLIFDSNGSRSMRIRDAVWLRNPDATKTLAETPLIKRADDLSTLAGIAGLPAVSLQQTVDRWNEAVAAGTDDEFNRFAPDRPDEAAARIVKPPFYAVQLYPLSRKSMGGLAVNESTEVVDTQGEPIPGLYAAGEVTGVAGINGSFGGEGTFLGPSVYMGRISGREAASSAGVTRPAKRSRVKPPANPTTAETGGSREYRAAAVTIAPEAMNALLAAERAGYWHFGEVHRTVQARGMNCLVCHSPTWPTKPQESPAEWRAQLSSCALCH